MKIEEYNHRVKIITDEYYSKLHRLKCDYVECNRKFNKGDFVYNVTGIIKVDKIGFEVFGDNIEITYTGYRYKKVKGILHRTKDNKVTTMWESNNLQLIK